MSYHVFIERAQDGADTAQVASAIAARYRLPEATIAKRMATGRFRVKANVDLDTAKAFARDLERLGAICTIADASSGKAATAAPQPAPVGAPPAAVNRPPAIPAGPVRPRSADAVAKAATVASAAPPPPEAQPSAASEYQSGLAAAFTASKKDSPELGAIDTGEFKLASLDGDEGVPASYAEPAHSAAGDRAFEPPDAAGEEPLALDTGDAPKAPAASAPLPPAAANAFAPPDSEEEELVLLDAPPPRKTPLPMTVAPPPAEALGAPAFGEGSVELTPSKGVVAPKPDLRQRLRDEFVDRPRVRFAAGIVLCLLLAWIPARIYWGSRVDNAQAELNLAMQEPTSLAKTDESAWLELEAIGRAQKSLAESRLVNTKITAVMIWLAVGGVLGFVYYRKIPWDDI